MKRISKQAVFLRSMFPSAILNHPDILKAQQSLSTRYAHGFLKILGLPFAKLSEQYIALILKEAILMLASYKTSPVAITHTTLLGHEWDVPQLLIGFVAVYGGSQLLMRGITYLVNSDAEKAASLRLQEYSLIPIPDSGENGEYMDELKGVKEAILYSSKSTFEIWAAICEYAAIIILLTSSSYDQKFCLPFYLASVGSLVILVGDVGWHVSLAKTLKQARSNVMTDFEERFNNRLGAGVSIRQDVQQLENTQRRKWFIEFSFSNLQAAFLGLGMFWIMTMIADEVMVWQGPYTPADFVILLFFYMKMASTLVKVSDFARPLGAYWAYFCRFVQRVERFEPDQELSLELMLPPHSLNSNGSGSSPSLSLFRARAIMKKLSKQKVFLWSMFPSAILNHSDILKAQQSLFIRCVRGFLKILGLPFAKLSEQYVSLILKEIILMLDFYNLLQHPPTHTELLGYQWSIRELLIGFAAVYGGSQLLMRIIAYLINSDAEKAASLRLQEYSLIPIPDCKRNGEYMDELKGVKEAILYSSKSTFEIWTAICEYAAIIILLTSSSYDQKFCLPFYVASVVSLVILVGDVYSHVLLAKPLKQARANVMTGFEARFNNRLGPGVSIRRDVQQLENTQRRKWFIEFGFSNLQEIFLGLGLYWITKEIADEVIVRQSPYTPADFVVLILFYMKMATTFVKVSDSIRPVAAFGAYFDTLMERLQEPEELELSQEEVELTTSGSIADPLLLSRNSETLWVSSSPIPSPPKQSRGCLSWLRSVFS